MNKKKYLRKLDRWLDRYIATNVGLRQDLLRAAGHIHKDANALADFITTLRDELKEARTRA